MDKFFSARVVNRWCKKTGVHASACSIPNKLKLEHLKDKLANFRLHPFPLTVFMCLSLSASLFARQEEPPKQSPPPDSLKNVLPADTLLTPAKADSITKTKKQKPRNRVFLRALPADSSALIFERDELHNLLYEDVAGLFQYLPGARVSRSADFGLFAQMGIFGAPPRFTEVQFDNIPWPKGFYGQSNLTALPEVFADRVAIAPQHLQLNFFSSPPLETKPWTYVEYVKGPFDVDVFRVRFRRAFSERTRAYLGLAFSNSDGQQLTLNGAQRGGPYDARKMYLRTEYSINRDYRIRHRLINTDNDAVAATPFFFEELPEIVSTNARYKEARNMNSLELAKTAQISDSAKNAGGEIDVWRLQIYNWRNREEYRDNSQGRFIQQKDNIFGGSLNWQLLKNKFSISTFASAERHRITSPTIDLSTRNRFVVQTHAQVKLDSRFYLDSEIRLLYHDDFETNLSGLGQITFSPRRGLHFYGKFERKISLPGGGEYANTLPSVLVPNKNLQVAELQKFESGLKWAQPKFRFFAQANRIELQNTLTLNLSDTLLVFGNLPQIDPYFAYTVSGSWLPFRGFELAMNADGAIEDVPENYTFWYIPKNNFTFEAKYSRWFFQNDLRVALMLRARYFGQRIVPEYQPGQLPTTTLLPGGYFVDAELKLFYKDAIIFFRFDNVFREKLDWRPLQPMRSLAFRYGINWRFWN
jgi:hypothetical protein